MSFIASILAAIMAIFGGASGAGVSNDVASNVSTYAANVANNETVENTVNDTVSVSSSSSSSSPLGVEFCVETVSVHDHMATSGVDNAGNELSAREIVSSVDDNNNHVVLNCFDLENGSYLESINVQEYDSNAEYALNV